MMKKMGMRILFIGLGLLVSGLGALAADPSAAELAVVQQYKAHSFDYKDLKKNSSDNGWDNYTTKDGLDLFVNPQNDTRALRLSDDTIVYRLNATAFRVDFPNGRIIQLDNSTGKVSWNLGVGDKAPQFILKYLDQNGFVNLESLKGSVVLLDFWASWCGPCREYMPKTQALYQKYKDKGLKVFALNVEGDEKLARGFVSELKLQVPVIMAAAGPGGFNWEAKQIKEFGVNSIPRAVLIDRKGIIQFNDTLIENEQLIDKLLASR